MKLPNLLYGNNKTRLQTVAFGGVNYSENHTEGEWEETENLGSGRYPALAPRLGRSVARSCEAAPTALYAWEELASVEGTGFYYGGKYIGEVSAGPKQMVRVGDQIVIWPDRKYYNWKTGEFTALAVGFTIDMGMSAVIGTDYVAIPTKYVEWKPTEKEPVKKTGRWLGVTQTGRVGVQYEYGSLYRQSGYDDDGSSYYYYDIANTKKMSVEGGTVGQMVRLDQLDENGASYWGQVTSITTEEREYMPGVTRKYTTVQYEKWKADDIRQGYDRVEKYSGGSFRPVTGSFSDWAYGTTNQTILRAELEPRDFGSSFYRKKAADAERQGYNYQSSPTLAGTPKNYDGNASSGKRVEVGDIIQYDETTGRAQMFVEIERGYYTDHYYTSSYTLQEVSLQEVETTIDPENKADAVSIRAGDNVRVSRGNASIRTKIVDFSASYTKADSNEVPGMAAAPYGVTFADNVTALRKETGPISIDRIAEPDMTHICVHDNRLWGVHEGRIWCSKFGDPQNFDTDTGTDADAWWTEVGSPGDWTGIVSYSGSVLAFKENLVHKVVGDLPSEFTVSTYNIAGIQPGSHQSAVIVNEVLYYKGTNGVYAYTGYTPSFLTENFGERKFTDAVGGTDGVRYYLTMRDEDGVWQTFCYNTLNRIWLREDSLHAAAYSLHEGKLYCAAEEEMAILTFGEAVEPDVPWSAVSVPFTEGSFDRKLYTKLLLRAELMPGSAMRVYASYDGGEWVQLYDKRGTRRGVAILPIRPRRCDRFRLKIEGEGNVTLLGMAREVLTGGEV